MSVDSPDWSFTAPLGIQTNGALAAGGQDKLPVSAAGCWLVTAQYSGTSKLQFFVQAQTPFNQQYDVFKMGPPLTLANPAGDTGSFLVPVPAASTLILNNPGVTGAVAYQAVFMAGPVPLLLLGRQPMASSQSMVLASDQPNLVTSPSYDGVPPDAGTWSTVIAIANYTASQTSPTLQNKTHRGLLINVQINSVGTGNINVAVFAVDPFAAGEQLWSTTAAITTAGFKFFMLYPGATKPTNTGLIEVVSLPIGDAFVVQVAKSDGSTWNFGVAVQLLS